MSLEIKPLAVVIYKQAPTAACTTRQKVTILTLLNRSTDWPAGKAKTNAGKNWNKPKRPRSNALDVMS